MMLKEVGVPVVIFDTSTQEFKENRIFDHDYAARFPGTSMWPLLRDRARHRGWIVMTSDVFLRAPSTNAVFMSDGVTPQTRALLDLGVVPLVLLSGESPNVAWGFYHWLKKNSQPYRHAFLFGGALARVAESVQTHQYYWPNSERSIFSNPPWQDRGYLVAVASNKERFQVASNKPLGLPRFAKRVVWNGLRLVDPLFRFEDLYQRRLDAFCYFAEVTGCKLFGRDWNRPLGWSKYPPAVRQARFIPHTDKLKVMANFRFALCFENCIFPGYLTEKIFDAFFAGCIPVYWGAPDIADFLPTETFVDARQFEDWTDLDQYLRGISERDSEQYRKAINSFLTSKDFDKFHQDTFVEELISIVDSEFVKLGWSPRPVL